MERSIWGGDMKTEKGLLVKKMEEKKQSDFTISDWFNSLNMWVFELKIGRAHV